MQGLFDEYAALALSRQRDLGAKIGDWSWDFDMDAGTMTFKKPGFLGFGGKVIVTQCQVLGSESATSETWLWSWANTQAGLPPSLLRAAEAMRARGEAEGIPELTERALPLAEWDGHSIAMIASGMRNCAGYYRGPYPGGALFVLLTGPELESPPGGGADTALLRFSTVLPEAIGSLPIHDHRLAARGLARGLGLRLTEGPTWEVSSSEGKMTCSFDGEGRLTKLDGQLRGR